MPLNIADAEDAWLGGSLDFEEFIQQFDMDFFAPLGEMMLSALAESFAALPTEVRQQLDQLAPGALDAVLGGLNNGTNKG